MANVLVTGGAGYVGSVCSAELLRLGHAVTIVDDLSTGFRESVPAGAAFFQFDIGDCAALQSLLKNVRFDVVFHFAAKALVAESVRDPGTFFRENVASGIAMLEVLRHAGVKNFVFSSSAAVYGIPHRVPIEEDDDPKAPVNSYGETKLMLERALDWYARAYGWSVKSFRYFNAAGATAESGEKHDPETHLIPLLLQTAAGERDVFTIYGDDYNTPDGTCVRDFVHVLDIARAHICALPNLGQPGMRAYNIGSGHGYSVRQVCDEVQKITNRKLRIRVEGRRPGDPDVLCANPARIVRELDWKAEYSSLEGIIRSAWQWKLRQTKQQSTASVP
jgi:UDP-glucose 4-epimerase